MLDRRRYGLDGGFACWISYVQWASTAVRVARRQPFADWAYFERPADRVSVFA